MEINYEKIGDRLVKKTREVVEIIDVDERLKQKQELIQRIELINKNEADSIQQTKDEAESERAIVQDGIDKIDEEISKAQEAGVTIA